jgi:hypothetical protein
MNNTEKFDLLPSHVDNINNRKVVYIGADGSSGYANAAKGYIYDLIRTNVAVKFVAYTTANQQVETDNTTFSFLINKKKNTMMSEPNEIIVHSIPEGWDVLLKNSQVNYTQETKIVGRTVWEFDKLPEKWVQQINNSMVTIVSVPTEWNKTTFVNSGVTKPIVVEPHIYIDYPYTPLVLQHILSKCVLVNDQLGETNFNKYYKFYNISQLIDRKGTDLLVESFCEAFDSNDNVALFLKLYRGNHTLNEQIETARYLKAIVDKYKKAPPIFLIKDVLTYDEIKTLHSLCDCYVSLTKTEGFGLGVFDAYQSKKDVIVTGYGGHLEYLQKDYDGLIPFQLVSVNSEIYKDCFLDASYKWAIADKKAAIELMQKRYKGIKSKVITVKNNDLSILYVGQYGTSGYATAAKQYIADYVMRNVPVRWEPLYFDESKLDNNNYVNVLAKSAINKKIDGYNTVILHCTPDLWPQYLEKHKTELIGKKVIGYTVWETNILKPEWVDSINLVSEVWCPSSYNKEVFEKSGVTIPVKVVPHLFFRNTLPEKSNVSIRGAIDGYYTFYNVSEYNERKNIKELLETYCQTFTSSDRVQLILKTHYKDYLAANVAHCKQEIDKILKKYPNHAHIVVIYDNLDEYDLLKLHTYGDCYITLTRSEGFGLTIFDAYNYGKQIIATGYSGYIDFLGIDYKGLINYQLINVDGMTTFNNNYNHTGQLWAQPDLEHAKVLMKKFTQKI